MNLLPTPPTLPPSSPPIHLPPLPEISPLPKSPSNPRDFCTNTYNSLGLQSYYASEPKLSERMESYCDLIDKYIFKNFLKISKVDEDEKLKREHIKQVVNHNKLYTLIRKFILGINLCEELIEVEELLEDKCNMLIIQFRCQEFEMLNDQLRVGMIKINLSGFTSLYNLSLDLCLLRIWLIEMIGEILKGNSMFSSRRSLEQEESIKRIRCDHPTLTKDLVIIEEYIIAQFLFIKLFLNNFFHKISEYSCSSQTFQIIEKLNVIIPRINFILYYN